MLQHITCIVTNPQLLGWLQSLVMTATVGYVLLGKPIVGPFGIRGTRGMHAR